MGVGLGVGVGVGVGVGDGVVPVVGIFNLSPRPTRFGFASTNCCNVIPFFVAMLLRVSPFFTVYLVVAAKTNAGTKATRPKAKMNFFMDS